jgi:FkbM family methyltransferase
MFSFIKNKIISCSQESASLTKWTRHSYAQEGEDILIDRILNNQKQGFFIDVGAHHPQRFSNTYYFYNKGWRGINVDAMPGSMKLFQEHRPEDINIEAAISRNPSPLIYYRFNEPALNTFIKEEAEKKDGLATYRIEEKITIQTTTLSAIIDQYLPKGKEVDFLTIDVEGLDLEVLQSNDWSRVKPRLIIVEDLSKELNLILGNSATRQFLEQQGYRLFSKLYNTCMYLRND